MREQAVMIGDHLPLVGVLSEPDPAQRAHPGTAVILLNSGVIHRVGSCRLSVTLARALSTKAGVSTFRFDFSGIGDSEARRGNLTAAQAAVEEVQEVMDYLGQTKQFERFILYGLCSGAFASYRTALSDQRVIGTVQLDGYCYMTWKSYVLHYGPKLLSLSRWANFVLRKLGLRKVKKGVEVSGIDERFLEVPNFANYPPRDEVKQGLQTLNRRGLDMLYVFFGNDYYVYEKQFEDCFKPVTFGDNLTVLHKPYATHILSEPEDRNAVVESITNWVKDLMRQPPDPITKQDEVAHR
ncbi:Serine aminopeptidase, S33 [Marinobacter sp. es.042]|uniref:serine aminopeptidase domain-containing protein n=1 Tax=Marinobacter sp. es.042 TaxID=1761794 RepID=UPI000B5044F1|nr:alpha/beta hydrolase [Marinobacter sp. es.042]SNB55509.1 Serine aminopeptidase, S33 [Marinobacter sp. es.042]